MSTDCAGLALCAIEDDPPPLASATSPTSDCDSTTTSVATLPSAPVATTAA
jgi:hypothetical protein